MKRPSFKIVEQCKSLLSSDAGENTAVLRQKLVTIVFYMDLFSLDILKQTVRCCNHGIAYN
jgi:hypothetical protein